MTREHEDKYSLAARILDRLAPELAAAGYDLVDVRIFQGGGRQQVRLYVDRQGPERIDLDGCAAASFAAGMLLEDADFFAGPYVLEVSSPGVRRPLRREEHFQAAVGREIQLKWRGSQATARGPLSLRGRLTAVANGCLMIAPTPRADAPPEALAATAAVATAEPAVATAEPAVATAEPDVVRVPLLAVLEANLESGFDMQEFIREDRRRRKQGKQAARGARRRRSADASRAASGTAAGGPRPLESQPPLRDAQSPQDEGDEQDK